MSFEHYLSELQRRSPREKRTVALVFSTAVFVPLVVVLFFLGAFSLQHTGGTPLSDVVSSVAKDAAPSFEDLHNGVSALTASTSKALDDLRSLASSTRQTNDASTTSSTTLGTDSSAGMVGSSTDATSSGSIPS